MAGILVASAVPFAAADHKPCEIQTTTTNVLPVGSYYLRVYARVGGGGELWEETNGVPGLQLSDTFCDHGVVVPRDTFVERF